MSSSGTAPLTIRHARIDDRREVERLYDICLRTGDNGNGAEHLTEDPRLLGEIYLGPYLRFEPDLAFVLEDADGSALGYVLGAGDTVAFRKVLEKKWWPALREKYPLGTFPVGSFDENLVELIHHPHHATREAVARFPAHLHIDILPEGQGGGNGRRLLETLFTALRSRGIGGVHLDVSALNHNAVAFYKHVGFHHLGENFWALAL